MERFRRFNIRIILKNYIITLCLVLVSCSFETPTQFSEAALNDVFANLEGEEITFSSIIESHKNKTILINVWATWCKDCIDDFPVEKALQQEFPDVSFVFLSLDRSEAAWKRGIKKYSLKGDHYFMKSGPDGPFWKFLNSNWTPRYLVVDKQSNIKLFKAKSASDSRIKEALK